MASALLDWFGVNARDLPWRRTRDPYAIWVSEIMLQQTQVTTVIPYWERWMREFPDLPSLAQAKPERVLKLWEGLGYYTRARNLHRAAQILMADRAGRFPSSLDDLLALPGVGRYTAGAVASIAFNVAAPILDGNVIRVLTRVFGLLGNPREKSAQKALWDMSTRLVTTAAAMPPKNGALASAGNCSSFNQGLMELGAMVCTPRQPDCEVCPLRKGCVAQRKGWQDRLPATGPRSSPMQQALLAFVVPHHGRLLARQRPSGVVNAHLWEFPGAVSPPAGRDLLSVAQAALGLRPEGLTPLCQVKHSITRHRITLRAFVVRLRARVAWRDAQGHWLTPAEIDQRPLTAAHRKVWRHYLSHTTPA